MCARRRAQAAKKAHENAEARRAAAVAAEVAKAAQAPRAVATKTQICLARLLRCQSAVEPAELQPQHRINLNEAASTHVLYCIPREKVPLLLSESVEHDINKVAQTTWPDFELDKDLKVAMPLRGLLHLRSYAPLHFCVSPVYAHPTHHPVQVDDVHSHAFDRLFYLRDENGDLVGFRSAIWDPDQGAWIFENGVVRDQGNGLGSILVQAK